MSEARDNEVIEAEAVPPAGLADRTVECLRREGLLVLRRPLLIRPITWLPLRLATAAILLLGITLLFYPGSSSDSNEAVSKRVPADYVVSVQRRLLGDRVTDHMGGLGDKLLDRFL